MTWMRAALRRWAWLLLGLAALPALAQPAQGQWGQRLLQTIDLPAEAVARLQQAPAVADAQAAPAQSEPLWRGPTLALSTEGSPYTVVIKASGTAPTDGEATLHLRAGWALDGTVHKLMLPDMAQPGAHAGQAVELTGVSIPVSMKQDREAALRIDAGSTANLGLARVQVEIWSGMGNVSMGHPLLSWVPLLLGLFFVGFVVWMRRQ